MLMTLETALDGHFAGSARPPRVAVRQPYLGEARVSVILPTHNRAELLPRAIRSVLAQSYRNFELVIIDDASTDATAEVVAAFDDARIRYHRNATRLGASASRARGNRIADGRFLAYIDSDDLWLRHKLWRQLAAAERSGSEAVVVLSQPMAYDGNAIYAPPVMPPVAGRAMPDYIYGDPGAVVISSGILVDGTLGRRISFDETLAVNEDTDLVLRLGADGAQVEAVDVPLFVQDVTMRGDRVTNDPALRRASYQWFVRSSVSWSRAARQGFLLRDYCLRCAKAYRMDLALIAYARGFSLKQSPWRLARQLLRVLCFGEVPVFAKRAKFLLRRLKRGAVGGHTARA